jgi:hypothetical protein
MLKAHQLLLSPTPMIPGVIRSKAILAIVVESESLLAIWLLVGGAPRARFLAAITCFTLFAAVASYEAIHSVSSCGCFGNVKVPPIITATSDVSAVVALWFTRPRKGDPISPAPSRRRVIGGASVALLTSAAL